MFLSFSINYVINTNKFCEKGGMVIGILNFHMKKLSPSISSNVFKSLYLVVFSGTQDPQLTAHATTQDFMYKLLISITLFICINVFQ